MYVKILSRQAAQRLSKATEFWDQGEYDYFGLETGGLIRVLCMLACMLASILGHRPIDDCITII